MKMDMIILGAGGHAKDIIKTIEEYNDEVNRTSKICLIGCFDDVSIEKKELLGYPVIHNYDEVANRCLKRTKLICGVGDPTNKIEIMNKFGRLKSSFINIIHPSVKLHRSIELGMGVSILSGSVLSYCLKIGDHVSIGHSCTVGHDTEIGNFTTLCPGVRIAGNVKIGENTVFGIGASCLQKLNIGKWSFVGIGTVVTMNLKNNSVVLGNPQRIYGKRNPHVAVV